ncbi:hypothetical protein [Paraburkholderia caribensis]
MSEFSRDHAFGVDTHPTDYVAEPAHFMAFAATTAASRPAITSAS